MTPQHITALQEANRIRLGRAGLKREIQALPQRQGHDMAAAVLMAPPDFLLTALVVDVLCWPTRMGHVRAEKMLRSACVGVTRKVGDITDRQRRDLGRCLRGLENVVADEGEDRNWHRRGHAA